MNKFITRTKSFIGSRGFSSGGLTAIVIAVIVALNAVIYALTAAFGLYIYSPKKESFEISGNTDHLFETAEALGKEVTITFCMPKDKLEKHDTGSYVFSTVKEFLNRYDFLKVRYVNLLTRQDENGERVELSKYKIDPLGRESTLQQSSVIFECGENFRVVTDMYSSVGFSDFFSLDDAGNTRAYIGEEIVGAMISWVLNNKHETVYFTQNHAETADISFSNLLTCAGYTVDFINLRDKSADEKLENAKLLIISNPVHDFERAAEGSGLYTEYERLQNYLGKGGQVMVSVDPYGSRLPVLEGLLSEFGIELTGAENENGRFVRDIVKESDNAISPDGLTFVALGTEAAGAPSRITDIMNQFGTGRVLLSQTGRLRVSGGAVPMLISTENSRLYRGNTVSDNGGSYVVAACSQKTNEDGSVARVFVTPGIFLTASNALIENSYSNKDFLYALLYEVFDAPVAVYGTNSINYEVGRLENFTMKNARTYTAIIMAVPALLAVAGAVIIIKRKNR